MHGFTWARSGRRARTGHILSAADPRIPVWAICANRRVAVAEPDVEHRRERRLDIRGIGQMKLEGLGVEQADEAAVDFCGDLLQAGVLLRKRDDVTAMHATRQSSHPRSRHEL